MKIGEEFRVSDRNKRPKDAVATVSSNISSEDYPYLIGQETIDPDTGASSWEAVIDEAAKAQALSDKATQDDLNAWAELRTERDRLLSETDYTQLTDAPMDSDLAGSYATYRQELRDLPDNTGDATQPTWPTEPS